MFKINFQLFAEAMSEEDKELFRYVGLDENGNPLKEDDDADNLNGPLDINTEPTVNPEDVPDNLPGTEPGAEGSEEIPATIPEDNSLNQPEEEPALTQQTTPILGKFKNQAELERAYLELQNRLGQQSNEIGEMRKRLYQPPEEKASDNGGLFDGIPEEDLLKSFSKNPRKFLTELMDISGRDTLEKAKAEIKAETEREKYLKEFFDGNSDFADLKEDFIVISDRVHDPEIALNAVRGMKLGKLDHLFSDSSYLKKHLDSPAMKEIFADVATADKLSEKVKQKIIDDYLKKAKESKSKVTLITNDAGSAPKTPPKKYDNFNDMTEDAVSFLKNLQKK